MTEQESDSILALHRELEDEAAHTLMKEAFEAMRDVLAGLRVFDDGHLVELWRNDQSLLARPAKSAEGMALRALERDRSSALAKVACYFEEACGLERPAIETAIDKEREAIANKAREWAANYSLGSDGRNTFILLAEWIEAR